MEQMIVKKTSTNQLDLFPEYPVKKKLVVGLEVTTLAEAKRKTIADSKTDKRKYINLYYLGRLSVIEELEKGELVLT